MKIIITILSQAQIQNIPEAIKTMGMWGKEISPNTFEFRSDKRAKAFIKVLNTPIEPVKEEKAIEPIEALPLSKKEIPEHLDIDLVSKLRQKALLINEFKTKMEIELYLTEQISRTTLIEELKEIIES